MTATSPKIRFWRVSRAVLFALLLSAVLPVEAEAQRVMHRVRFGETATTISLSYYGSKAFAHLIKLANGIPARTGKVKPGSYIRVPTAWVYTARRTTTLKSVAARYLGDKRRWPAIAMLNKIRGRRKRIRKGKTLLVPFTVPYRVTNRDQFVDLSRRFYGTKKYGGLIASYNFISATQPSPGTQLEIPLGAPRIAPLVLKELTNERLLGVSGVANREDREGLQEANALLRRGDYWAVPLRLLQLLGMAHPSDSHIAEVFKLLAVAYVAVDQRDLAVKAFREALLRQPGMTLDVVTTSPSVIRAFVDAKSGLRRGNP